MLFSEKLNTSSVEKEDLELNQSIDFTDILDRSEPLSSPQKSVLLDMVYLQQDAFDAVDATTSRERQVESFGFLKRLIDTNYGFDDRDTARDFFTQLTSLYKNWNYSPMDSNDYTRFRDEMSALAARSESHPERVLPT